ncbi:MAG: trkA2 [Anaerocolumna sp.]|jgi:trk system potassium uptake protein TrkA|nr:trkA2 [Anaerocolumna sp.]
MYIIIIGCGRFGSNLAKRLSDEGNNVCIIDRDGEKLNALGSGFNAQKIKGIEFDSDILREAGIDKADVLIAVTSNDNINITVSMIADKFFQVPHIIARVNDPEKTYIYHKIGIDTLNPVEYELEVLKSKLPLKSLDVIYTLDDVYEIIVIPVNRKRMDTKDNIESTFHCIISSIIRNGEVKIPKQNEQIQIDDKLICTVCSDNKIKLINYLCKEMIL